MMLSAVTWSFITVLLLLHRQSEDEYPITNYCRFEKPARTNSHLFEVVFVSTCGM